MAKQLPKLSYFLLLISAKFYRTEIAFNVHYYQRLMAISPRSVFYTGSPRIPLAANRADVIDTRFVKIKP